MLSSQVDRRGTEIRCAAHVTVPSASQKLHGKFETLWLQLPFLFSPASFSPRLHSFTFLNSFLDRGLLSVAYFPLFVACSSRIVPPSLCNGLSLPGLPPCLRLSALPSPGQLVSTCNSKGLPTRYVYLPLILVSANALCQLVFRNCRISRLAVQANNI